MQNDIESILISAEEIEAKVAEVGRRITEDFRDKDPIFVGVLKGCFIFMADLMRHVDINCLHGRCEDQQGPERGY